MYAIEIMLVLKHECFSMLYVNLCIFHITRQVVTPNLCCFDIVMTKSELNNQQKHNDCEVHLSLLHTKAKNFSFTDTGFFQSSVTKCC